VCESRPMVYAYVPNFVSVALFYHPLAAKKKQVLPFYWVTVCKTVHPMLSVRSLSVLSVCPVCLSVTLVHCGQTFVWIQMKLGLQVGLDPGHSVLDGDPAPPPPKGHSPPILVPYLLWPNGWMDQNATW